MDTELAIGLSIEDSMQDCVSNGALHFLLDQIGFDTWLDAGLNSGLVYWIECRIGY